MIKVQLSAALVLYLLSGMVLIFSIWFLAEFRKRAKSLKGEEEFVWKCPTCTNVYIDSKAKGISRCPLCGSLVKKGEEK